MSMRAFFTAILVLAVGGAIALGAYDAGMAHGVTQVVAPAAGAVPAAGGAPSVVYYGHPYGWGGGWGFGFFPFGFFFPLFGLFLFFGLMRAIFGGWRHRGWYGDGEHGVPGRFEEWHKRAHGDRPASPPQ